MTIPTSSPAETPAFRAWLGRTLDLAEPYIVDVSAPTGGGWSSETWLMTVRDGMGHDTGRRVVLRLAPGAPAMFPEYDLSRQVACMQALKGVPNCPVPTILGGDMAGAVIGRPFYLMAFVPGDIPSDDRPTLFEAGFLFDASPADQHRFHLNFLKTLAALHAFECPLSLAAKLARRDAGTTALARETAWLRHLFDWGRGPAPQLQIDQALIWLSSHRPDEPAQVLLWGDARPANVVVRDFTPVALLDWELATLGPPEFDVFWLLEMNRMRSRGRSLPGFLGDPETIETYQRLTGRSLDHARWHTLFAATKVAILMLRHLRLRVAAGDIPESHPILTDNVATRRLGELLA